MLETTVIGSTAAKLSAYRASLLCFALLAHIRYHEYKNKKEKKKKKRNERKGKEKKKREESQWRVYQKLQSYYPRGSLYGVGSFRRGTTDEKSTRNGAKQKEGYKKVDKRQKI